MYRCLQKGLRNPNASLTQREENQYALYNDTREKVLNAYHKNCELYKYDLRQAANDEVFIFWKKMPKKNYFFLFKLFKKEAMMKIFEAGHKYKNDETLILQQNYLLNLSSNESVNPDAKIPFLNLRNVFLRPNIDEGKIYYFEN